MVGLTESEYVYSSDSIHERDRQTGGLTDGNCMITNAALCIASCGKKGKPQRARW